MKNKSFKTAIVYILVVLLPAIIGCVCIVQVRATKSFDKQMEEAKWVASIRASHWNQFITDTITSLEMLSLTAHTLVDNFGELQPLLARAHQSDPRYGGIYLLSPNGEWITGSDNQLFLNGLARVDFTSEVIHTKDVFISNHQFNLENGQKVISLSSPILDENNQLLAVIVALIRSDYVGNLMKVLTPEAELVLINGEKDILLRFNIEETADLENGKWLTIPMESVPWNIKVKVKDGSTNALSLETFVILLIFLFFTHILFLLIKYFFLKRQAENERRENDTQKLKLVGSLAASTAHEIRNPLTGIKGLVQLLGEKHKSVDDQFYFTIIYKEIDRINQIASEFLILGKPTAQDLKTEDISSIISELEPIILSEASSKNMKIVFSFPTTPIPIKCAKDQMKQVILNITKNAFDAMSEEGTLTIKLAKKGSTCVLTFIDDGRGIPKENFDHIFTPFYTSKETGTGLGLVVCQRILQSFGGEIQITSREHKGTTVSIRLPVV